MLSAADAVVTTSPVTIETAPRMTADELVAVAIRCILEGREFPEHLRAASAISPGLASVEARVAKIFRGEL